MVVLVPEVFVEKREHAGTNRFCPASCHVRCEAGFSHILENEVIRATNLAKPGIPGGLVEQGEVAERLGIQRQKRSAQTDLAQSVCALQVPFQHGEGLESIIGSRRFAQIAVAKRPAERTKPGEIERSSQERVAGI